MKIQQGQSSPKSDSINRKDLNVLSPPAPPGWCPIYPFHRRETPICLSSLLHSQLPQLFWDPPVQRTFNSRLH